jgi:hypothetical protein
MDFKKAKIGFSVKIRFIHTSWLRKSWFIDKSMRIMDWRTVPQPESTIVGVLA